MGSVITFHLKMMKGTFDLSAPITIIVKKFESSARKLTAGVNSTGFSLPILCDSLFPLVRDPKNSKAVLKNCKMTMTWTHHQPTLSTIVFYEINYFTTGR